MSWAALNLVKDELGARCKNSGDVAVMLLYANAANDAGLAWLEQGTVAESMPVSHKAVNAAVGRITDRGLWDKHEYWDRNGYKRVLLRFRVTGKGVKPITNDQLPKGVSVGDLPTGWLNPPIPLERTRPDGDAQDGPSATPADDPAPRDGQGRFAPQGATQRRDEAPPPAADADTPTQAPSAYSAVADKAHAGPADKAYSATATGLGRSSGQGLFRYSGSNRSISRSTKDPLPADAGEHEQPASHGELVAALDACCMSSADGAVAKAASQLRDAGATTADVAARAGRLRDRWGPAAVTAPALAKWWPSLAGEPTGPQLPDPIRHAVDKAHVSGLAGVPWDDVAHDLDAEGHDDDVIAAARAAFDRATDRGAA